MSKALVKEADQEWAEDQMEEFVGALSEADDIAADLLANWSRQRNVSRFWPGKDLSEVMRERYPKLGVRSVQMMLSVAATKAALPAKTKGMSRRAVQEAGSVTEQERDESGRKSPAKHVSPVKVAKVEEIIDTATAASGGKPPTTSAVKAAKTALSPSHDGWPEARKVLRKCIDLIGRMQVDMVAGEANVYLSKVVTELVDHETAIGSR